MENADCRPNVVIVGPDDSLLVAARIIHGGSWLWSSRCSMRPPVDSGGPKSL